jgi:ABC-2 type transport system permease protein
MAEQWRLFALAAGAVWRREMIHFVRERNRVLGFVLTPLIFWFIVGSGFGDMPRYFAGSLLLSVMFTAVFSTMSLIEDRREGFLLAMLAAPAPRCAVVTGKVLGGTSMALAQGLLFCLFLPLAGGAWTSLAAAAGAIALSGFAFTSLGFWMAWKSSTPQGFHAIMNIVLMPLWLVSGALFGKEQAHGWMQALMAVNPLTPMHSILRQSARGEAWGGIETATVALLGIAFLTLSIYAVERNPQGGTKT